MPPDSPTPRHAATEIVRVLHAAGHAALFAGGCVRDELLGRTPDDYDVATDAVPDRVRALFPRTAAVGAHFGVVLVRTGPVVVEVATFRADGTYSDARRPDAVHFSTPDADARRRDYTVNALFLDPHGPPDALPDLNSPQGRVIDYVGGLDDLRAGVLRAVGDPDLRLAEDHLRALRAVRLAAKLGFTIEPATAAAIARHAADLRGVSRERIGDEVRMMLALPTRARAVEILTTLQLDASTLDAPHAPAKPSRLAALGEDPAPLSLALAAWALDREALPQGQGAELARSWRRALCLSNDETDGLAAIFTHRALIRGPWASLAVAQRKRAAAKPWFQQALRLLATEDPHAASLVGEDVRRLASDGIGLAPDPLVNGDHLVALGIRPGPKFRSVLDRVYDEQLAGTIRERSAGVELARRLLV